MNTRDAYVQKLKAQLDEWDAELDKLDAKAVKAEGDAKIRYEEKIKELCREHEEAQQRLTEIQKASGDAWEELKEDAERTWNTLNESFSNAKSEFEGGYREGLEE